jgi:hypothetical protein
MGKVIDQGGQAEPARNDLLIDGLGEVLGNQFPEGLTFEAPGITHTLTVTDGRPVQDRDFDDGHLLTWSNGDPKMILVVIGRDEDGKRASWWVRGSRATRAFKRAYIEAEATGLARGDVLDITRGQDEEIPSDKKGGKSTFANTWDVKVTPAGMR